MKRLNAKHGMLVASETTVTPTKVVEGGKPARPVSFSPPIGAQQNG